MPSPFIFEQAWVRGLRCKAIVKESWHTSHKSSNQFKFCQKIKSVKQALKIWNKDCFQYCDEQVKELMNKIGIMQQDVPSIEHKQLEIELNMKFWEILKRQKLF